jgi:hypothetical protein
LNIPKRRKILLRKTYNFGPEIGEHLVEISIYRNKFYILIVEIKNNKSTPHLIELFLSQAKKLFQYCRKSYTELLDLIEFKYGKFQLTKLNKLFNQTIQTYFSPRESYENSKLTFNVDN